MSDASKRGKRSRTKGRRFEQEVAKKLRDKIHGCTAKRGMQFRGGAMEPDVELIINTKHGGIGFHIECKCGKNPNILKAYEQANAERDLLDIPAAVTKSDRCTPLITISLDAFIDLLYLVCVEAPVNK